MIRALLVDAYDSFVHVIAQYLATLDISVTVLRVDAVEPSTVADLAPDFVVLGPGPGHPAKSGYLELLGDPSIAHRPILGICLGHQAIGMAFGAPVHRAPVLRHGKTSVINHDGKGCFRGLEPEFEVTRYHSLVVASVDGSSPLSVTATSMDDRQVMGLRHVDRPIESVQFHPESISSEYGARVLDNFVRVHVHEYASCERVIRERTDDRSERHRPCYSGHAGRTAR